MADIELVIKIPKESYKATCKGSMLPPDVENVVNAIKNGTPLPKGKADMVAMLTELQAEIEEKQEQTIDEKRIDAIDFAIKATDSQDDYGMGMRNGMRYVKSLIDGKEPEYELRLTDDEIKLGIDLGDEVVNEWGTKGVVVGIDTYKGEVLLSLLMGNHKVPQLVHVSNYKTKTGRHFPQIREVLKQMKGEADGK